MTQDATGGTWTAERIISIIRELADSKDLPEHLSEGEIKGSDTVDSLGMDSIGGVYLIERLEEETGILMPDDFVELDFDLDEIAARLNRLLEKQP